MPWTIRGGRPSGRWPSSRPSGWRSAGRWRTTSRCASPICRPRTPSPCRSPRGPGRAAARRDGRGREIRVPSSPAVDPIGVLAETAGYDDPERWWEDVIEHRARDGAAAGDQEHRSPRWPKR
ncbi:DUF5682 family protein [Streptomyces sp. M10(2022)]